MNSKLFVNNKYILNFAIACYRLPYLVIVHMNYCLYFSTCLCYKFKNCKKYRQIRLIPTVHYIKHKLNEYRILNFSYSNTKLLPNIQMNQIFVAALIRIYLATYTFTHTQQYILVSPVSHYCCQCKAYGGSCWKTISWWNFILHTRPVRRGFDGTPYFCSLKLILSLNIKY